MKTKLFKTLLLLLLLSSCNKKSKFIADCSCDKITLEEGIIVTDILQRYQITYPNETWEPAKHNDELGNGIVGTILEGISYKSFSVLELPKIADWESKEAIKAEIQSKFNVIGSGSVFVDGIESMWNMTDSEDGILTIYITVEHPTKPFFYTLNLSVSKDKYGENELCELEKLLFTFKLI